MEGTIKIEALPGGMGVSVMMDVRHVSKIDMMGVFDALAKGFQLDEKERTVFGLMLAAGGLDAAGVAKTMTVKADEALLKILDMMKEKNNETDAH